MIRPAYLKKGDTIGIAAPSNSIEYPYIENAIRIFESWGLHVVTSSNISGSHYQFAGNDPARLEALQEMFDAAAIKAIICARGGYGLTRIIDRLSLEKFRTSPKWVIGFSDVSVLLLKIINAGIECIHGPMTLTFDSEKYPEELSFLRKMLFGESTGVYRINQHSLNRPGTSSGMLTGGNLSLLCCSIGTQTDFDTRGKILFIEETDEYLYRIDRMAGQLHRAGKFNRLAGLVIGHMSNIKENDKPFDRSVTEIFREYTDSFDFPVCFHAPAGHSHPNFPLPFGKVVHLNVGTDEVEIRFDE